MKRQQTQVHLGESEDDFQKFETKIDQVLHLLKAMNSCDKKNLTPTVDFGEE